MSGDQAHAVSPQTRRLMQNVRRSNTGGEVRVRKILHAMGLRFRLNQRSLPGSPDIVLARWRTVVFVHGCFWHRHEGCKRATTPKTRTEFWLDKFSRNVVRDARQAEELERLGWRVLVVWECELARESELRSRLGRLFTNSPHSAKGTRGSSHS